ncbi:MAG: glycosyltransferase, partial [Nanoarchaeota archaeon]|nr:glycosyltransferase [Nanoarchaeota archaeon]
MRLLAVIPAYNEERILEKNALKVYSYLKKQKYEFTLLIAVNGSTDNSEDIARGLSKTYSQIKFISIKEKGRGLALKKAFSGIKADYYCYIDADLSPDLLGLGRILDSLKDQDICIASRYAEGAKIKRSVLRYFVSKCFNHMMGFLFRQDIKDYQCGLKGFRKSVLPLIMETEDIGWFFDTELLVKASRDGFRIRE